MRCGNAVITMRSVAASGMALLLLFARSTRGHADAEVQALAVAAGVVAASELVLPNREEPDFVAFEVGRFDAVKPATRKSLQLGVAFLRLHFPVGRQAH